MPDKFFVTPFFLNAIDGRISVQLGYKEVSEEEFYDHIMDALNDGMVHSEIHYHTLLTKLQDGHEVVIKEQIFKIERAPP